MVIRVLPYCSFGDTYLANSLFFASEIHLFANMERRSATLKQASATMKSKETLLVLANEGVSELYA